MMHFDGVTYDPVQDFDRLSTQFERVAALMADGGWHTLREIADRCGASEAGVSARLRDFRKARFGGKQVERRRRSGGLFEYRVTPEGRLF